MSRPGKLTSDVQKRIADAVALGSTYELAAQYGGISYDCFNNWMIRGRTELVRMDQPRTQPRDEEAIYVQFFQAVKDAEGRAVVGWLAKIERAANDGHWQAAAWKLERRYPREYGRTFVNQEISGPDGGPIQVREVTIEVPSDEPVDS